tara:strand:+ start:2027 stop:2185 length:159 start_codon:yes stop_codon:yes gene_type:complete
MTKIPKKEKPEDVETHPDSWERFQKTMDKILPPKRRKDSDDADNTSEDTRGD